MHLICSDIATQIGLSVEPWVAGYPQVIQGNVSLNALGSSDFYEPLSRMCEWMPLHSIQSYAHRYVIDGTGFSEG